MVIEPVDPRDSQWEADAPAYRVYLWRTPDPVDTPAAAGMVASDEYRLRDVRDVSEALAWAKSAAGPDRTFSLYVEHTDDGSPGLIRLQGADPTRP